MHISARIVAQIQNQCVFFVPITGHVLHKFFVLIHSHVFHVDVSDAIFGFVIYVFLVPIHPFIVKISRK